MDSLIGDYRILKRTLGQGTFGKVKLAENIYTKEQVSFPYISIKSLLNLQTVFPTDEIKLIYIF